MELRSHDTVLSLHPQTGEIYSLKRKGRELMHQGGAPGSSYETRQGWDRTELTMFPIVGPVADDWLILDRDSIQYQTPVEKAMIALESQAEMAVTDEASYDTKQAAQRVLSRLKGDELAIPMTKHGIARHYPWQTVDRTEDTLKQRILHEGYQLIGDTKHSIGAILFPYDVILERIVSAEPFGYRVDNTVIAIGEAFSFAHGNHPSFSARQGAFQMQDESFTLDELRGSKGSVRQGHDHSLIYTGEDGTVICLASGLPYKAAWTRGEQFCLEDLTRPMDKTLSRPTDKEIRIEPGEKWNTSMGVRALNPTEGLSMDDLLSIE